MNSFDVSIDKIKNTFNKVNHFSGKNNLNSAPGLLLSPILEGLFSSILPL
jgi:hypothetical protein